MFGKSRATGEISDELTVDQFFGDESAAEEAVQVEDLRDRLEHVEQQLSSQFTSLAAYAQIAQEQIETARAEAKHSSERTERRVTELIERERKDRIEAIGSAPAPNAPGGWTAPGTDDRLDAIERTVAQIQHGLNECLARQKALADAITALFEPQVSGHYTVSDVEANAPTPSTATLPPPATTGSDAISELSIL